MKGAVAAEAGNAAAATVTTAVGIAGLVPTTEGRATTATTMMVGDKKALLIVA